METNFRPPTRFDIGRKVEVSDDGDDWTFATLEAIYARFFVVTNDGQSIFNHCRVPYTTPDPIAELSAAADWLAERGQDEAASILLNAIAIRSMKTPETQP